MTGVTPNQLHLLINVSYKPNLHTYLLWALRQTIKQKNTILTDPLKCCLCIILIMNESKTRC